MSVHEEILGFLDGTLPADAEAELLHRMSVSPERRGLLRSYFQQQSLIAQDKSSINVPYDAEQGLWSRLDRVMPPVAAMAPAAMMPAATSMTAASTAGFFTKLSASSSALVAGLLLFVGFGGGYLANNGQDNTTEVAGVSNNASANNTSASNAAVAPQIIYRDAEPQIITKERIVTRYITRYVNAPVGASDVAALNTESANADVITSTTDLTSSATPTEPKITLAAPITPTEMQINVGGEQNKPVFASVASTGEEAPEKSFIERFEFSLNESFGRQYPNTEATNTTLPLITNSSISTYFQVLPRSEKLWAGFSIGTANVTRKTLSTTNQANSPDPTEEEVVGEYIHVQTNWMGGFLQYRIPVSASWDLTTTAGYGFATAGQMAIGEIGAHVDVTKDVGFTLGLRGTRLSYELKGEMTELMENRKGSLSVPRGVSDATPSFNLEIATGLFFHF
jgi:hypothetical protein